MKATRIVTIAPSALSNANTRLRSPRPIKAFCQQVVSIEETALSLPTMTLISSFTAVHNHDYNYNDNDNDSACDSNDSTGEEIIVE